MANTNPPKKNQTFTIRWMLNDFGTPGAFKSNPTIASGDAKVDTDGGGFGNPGTLPSVSPAASVAVLITLSTSEMNGDLTTFYMIDQTSPKEWSDFGFCIQTTT